MIVRYDPRDLSRVHLLAPDGCYYDLTYRELRRPPISLWEHRLALKRLREEGRAQVDEDAIFTAIDAMRGIAERASTATKTARPLEQPADGYQGLAILTWMFEAWPMRTQAALAMLRAVRPRRQMQRWPALDPMIRDKVEALFLTAWPEERNNGERGWWRA
jgi:hypothetical protein